MMELLLKVENLQVEFQTVEGCSQAVSDVALTLGQSESLGIVGESGGGKSVVSLSILRLIPDPPGKIKNGNIWFDGRDLLKLPVNEMQNIRGNKISMIFQEPMTSLNPLHTCGEQIAEPMVLHQELTKAEAREKSQELLKQVGLPEPRRAARLYPHQISGGMRQRIMIAMALACRPKLLIADEPTTALDVTIEAQIMSLMKDLKREIQAGIILITHNLALVAEFCDRIIVMYCGRIVEEAPVDSLVENPKHPYTVGLINSLPKITKKKKKLKPIRGAVPNPCALPPGCSFHPRCDEAMDVCLQEMPVIYRSGDNMVRCWKYA